MQVEEAEIKLPSAGIQRRGGNKMKLPDYYGVGRKTQKKQKLSQKYLLGKIYRIVILGDNDDLTDEEMKYWEKIID